MIKRTLFSFIKKKILLFVALIFICTLGVTCATGFLSAYFDIKKGANDYINNYGIPDIILNTNKEFLDSDVKEIKVDGAIIFYRYQSDTYIQIHNKSFKTKVTTFDDASFSKRYVVSESENITAKPNINIDYIFANHNNIKAGESATLLLTNKQPYEMFIDKIVGNPEAILPSIGGNVPRDQYDFGCSYVNKKDVDIANNQVIVKIVDNSKSKETIYKEIKSQLENSTKNIGVVSCIYKENNSSYRQINSTINDLKKAAVYVPLVTISILLIMVFLFMFQVTRSLTHEFGIMMAMGISHKSIYSLMISFSGFITIISSILGTTFGHGLSLFIYNKMKNGFGVPIGYGGVLFNIILPTIFFTFLATFLAVTATILIIRKINPKEAINNNKDSYKPLPKGIEKIVDKVGNANKIAISSILKEKIRSFVSIFAIIATFSVCFSSFNLYKSETGLIKELYGRYNFEAEIYIMDNKDIDNIKSFVIEEKNKGIVKEYEYVKTSYLKFAETGGYYTICGVNNSDMHIVKNAKDERIYINQEDAIVLDELYAREANLKKGDKITINGYSIIVQDIAHECTYKKNYMSYNTLTKIVKNSGFQESIAINTNDLTTFVNDISLLFTKIHVLSSEKFLLTATTGHQAIVLLSLILVIIGAITGFTILATMAITSNYEQKRKFSVMRALGLKLSDISKVLFNQNITFLFFGFLFGIPAGYFLGVLLVNISTSKHNALLNYNYWWSYLLVAGLIILITLGAHLVSLINIKHTNIVENTCSRE